MCMLSYFPEGVLPLCSEIANGADLNPDGHGFAIVTRDKRLIIQKGMNADEIISAFIKARARYPEGPALFHSRIATSGLVDVTGCHPFKVGQDNRTVIGHNGILFQPKDDTQRSDTRIFAEEMLPRMGSLDSQRKMRQIERFVGRGNKLVILTVNPARRRNAYIVNEDAGFWAPSGAWHSNYDYEGNWWDDDAYVYSGARNSAKPKVIRYGNSVYPCEVCGAYDAVSLGDSVCEVCNACNDCKMNIMHCMCYVPQSQRKPASELVGGWAHNS